MGAIDNHLSAALSVIQSANAKIKQSSANARANNPGFQNTPNNPSRPYVLAEGTVVEDPSDIHLYNMRPTETPEPDRDFTSGVKDSFDRSQNEYSYNETHRMDDNSGNPFNRDNWDQTGVSYEEKKWDEETYSIERGNEPSEPEKSWIDEHTDAKAKVWDTEIEALNHEGSVHGNEWENEHHKAGYDVLGYETNGEASVSIGRDGVEAEASASAEVYVFKAEYEATYGPGYTRAETSVGADAEVTAAVNFNPTNGDASVTVGGEAFAGGKVEVATGVEGQYGKAEANAGVTYGIGGEAKADVGIEDGKIKAEIDLAATVGLGFDVGFEVEIDAKETAKSATGWIPGTPW